jgi:apolipoprotein N-acyltransferase
VQGNLEAKQKRDIRLLEPNLERYRALSKSVLAEGAELLLWPETVATSWLPEEFKSVRGTPYDVFPSGAVPLFYGGLSVRQRASAAAFNAVFLRNTEGLILARYYKRILMPFGEYMPFADLIPALRELSPATGDFTVGDQPITTTVSVRKSVESEQTFGVGMLICYEDLVPSLSNEAVDSGANILVNFTNDAWYGETAAPYQHHMLAAWRAVEVNRYLLRVTNTGVTGIVNPLGETERELPIFKEGTIVQPVKLLTRRTVQARVGDWPVVVLAAIVVLVALNSWFKRKE